MDNLLSVVVIKNIYIYVTERSVSAPGWDGERAKTAPDFRRFLGFFGQSMRVGKTLRYRVDIDRIFASSCEVSSVKCLNFRHPLLVGRVTGTGGSG